ncbi:DUF7344 domain-containing protein [Halorubrum cibi]|uniref:DUF7344 domain-containing protein n=1 Tax=Halorubrum cibi TaxID=413815 RepID=A0A521C2T8_9EURY|nr:hypothetical protein [Halorubrum cibi]SMO53772.1 hypothetical protein SAMN06264867_103265 [Halorubrum cibi]
MIAKPDGDAHDPNEIRPETTRTGLVDADTAAGADRTDIEEASIGFDQLFEILKNERRRRVLRYLIEVDGEVTLSEIAEEIAARETEKDVKQITSQERKRVYVGLYQCHLPKMDDYGAISYNKPRGRIETGEHTSLFQRYVCEDRDSDESEWTRYHSMLSLGIVLLLAVPVLIGVVVSSATVQVGVALLVGTLVGVSAIRFVK